MSLNKTIQWHPAFIAGLKIELEPYRDILSIESEYTMNKKPRRLDALITKQPDSAPIDSPIAAFFLHYNVIDYKGPSESRPL